MRMAFRLVLLTGVACGTAAQNGCSQSTKTGSLSADRIALCSECGQVKGSETCCQPGQPLCEKCGLAKGSPGCCRVAKEGRQPVYLCAKCGFIKGGADCCKPNQTTCSKCGLVKGSPGCCKMQKAG